MYKQTAWPTLLWGSSQMRSFGFVFKLVELAAPDDECLHHFCTDNQNEQAPNINKANNETDKQTNKQTNKQNQQTKTNKQTNKTKQNKPT